MILFFQRKNKGDMFFIVASGERKNSLPGNYAPLPGNVFQHHVAGDDAFGQ